MDTPKSIAETQNGLLARKFSAVELVDSYLKTIAENKDMKAYITISDERAYQDAKKVDKLIADLGKKAFLEFPLLGVTVSHKDLFLTKGIRTTAGSKVLDNYIPQYSATVVKKLEDSGTILIGKTNCDAWAHGASGENSDYGPTKNPYHKEYVPGGSSSGSAVAVAKDMTLISTGTDTGGSIRQPANFCGVIGFKPTYGAVSRYGIIAMASSLDSVGHFAKRVEDIEKVFQVTRGEDRKDATVKNFQFPLRLRSGRAISNSQKNTKKITIGIPKEYFIEGIDKEVAKNVLDAAKVFENMGINLKEVSLPHTKYAISVYYIVQSAEVSSNLARYDGIRYGSDRHSFGEEAKRRIMLGTYVLSAGYYDAYYLKAMQVRSKIIQDFDEAFERVDAILAPVCPTPPFKMGEKAGNPLQMYLADILTVAANLAGIPGLAMPFNFSKAGLPLGFQLLGKRFSEETLFNLGKSFAEQTT
ncbi:MAG: Asp-tRNA(Asn)/Glu-tRNA(Gln) amidotransferase subunit GatA [Patescibacteria group bacterium]